MITARELQALRSYVTERAPGAITTVLCWCVLTVPTLAGEKTATSRTGMFETTTVWPNYPGDEPSFRVPALIVSPGGDLLAFAERRNKRRWGDWGDFDVVMKRSTDNGRTWGPTRVLYDYGSEPCPDITLAVDRVTGEILLFFLRGKVEYCLMRSSDDGQTWSEPSSIHADVVRPEWDAIGVGREGKQRYGVGPGAAAIQLSVGPHAGRILVPGRHIQKDDDRRLRTFNHTFYSDDHGRTWQLGGIFGRFGNEAQLVELSGGSVMINARDGDNRARPNHHRRRVAVSRDGGITWGAMYRDEALISTQCHGSIERLTTAAEDGPNRFLFANPRNDYRTEKHPYGRVNVSVRISYDEGRTWSKGRTIYPHESAYTDLAVLPDKTIGLIYERGPAGSTKYWDHVQFARFDLAWLTNGKDTLKSRR